MSRVYLSGLERYGVPRRKFRPSSASYSISLLRREKYVSSSIGCPFYLSLWLLNLHSPFLDLEFGQLESSRVS